MNNITKMYHVTTEGDVEGKTTRHLGYATGELEDIKKFYDSRKYYNLSIRECEVVHITPDMVNQRKELEKEREELKHRLDYLNKVL